MASYFNYFPTTFYTSGANNATALDIVTNITSRFGFEQSLKENSAAFYPYLVKDDETPETIAYKMYGNAERHWVVLMFNDIIDPQYDWPMGYDNLVQSIDKKYQGAEYANNATTGAGLTWAQNVNNVQAYYKIITRTPKILTGENKTITEKIQVTANTYANVSVTTTDYTLQNGTKITESITKERVTYYDYEVQLNEDKRKINLLKSEFVPAVFKEFKQVIA